MPSTAIRELISRERHVKGKFYSAFSSLVLESALILVPCRFGWVNASYVYGLEILNAHMRRSLGAITPYETYKKAIDASDKF
jgi:hypothetical protein